MEGRVSWPEGNRLLERRDSFADAADAGERHAQARQHERISRNVGIDLTRPLEQLDRFIQPSRRARTSPRKAMARPFVGTRASTAENSWAAGSAPRRFSSTRPMILWAGGTALLFGSRSMNSRSSVSPSSSRPMPTS